MLTTTVTVSAYGEILPRAKERRQAACFLFKSNYSRRLAATDSELVVYYSTRRKYLLLVQA
jgi:hypothetical protein